MPRTPRLHIPGGFYHTTLRGNHRNAIFSVDSDRLLLNTIVEFALAKHGASVHAYCWMTNHLHMLVQVGTDPLAHLIRRIASGYARAYQANQDTTGHLFENRYHAVLVDSDAYLLELIRYIHLNPVRAKLVPKVQLYRWSSHHAYRGLNVDRWVTTDFALRMFAVDRPKAHSAYREFVNCDLEKIPSPFDAIQPDRPHILGGEEFVERMSSALTKSPTNEALDALIAEGCQQHGLSRGDVEGDRRNVRVSQARAWIASEAVARGLATVTAVARAIRCDPKTLARAIRERAEKAKSDLTPT
jgi:REP element-mobilizing transposase RayT